MVFVFVAGHILKLPLSSQKAAWRDLFLLVSYSYEQDSMKQLTHSVINNVG